MDPVQPDLVQTQSEDSLLNKILKITLILLIVISVRFGGFLIFQVNNKKSSAVISPSTISPTVVAKKVQATISPTIQQEDPNSLDVGSVEADLKDIGTDVESLK